MNNIDIHTIVVTHPDIHGDDLAALLDMSPELRDVSASGDFVRAEYTGTTDMCIATVCMIVANANVFILAN